MNFSEKKAQNKSFSKKDQQMEHLLGNKKKDNSGDLPSDETLVTSSSSTSQHEAVSSLQICPEKAYNVRSGTVNHGWEYEYKLAALLAIRCIRHDVKQMWLASNADGVSDFDDIILNIKRTKGKEITFMLQVKHQNDPKNLSEKDFFSPKGDLNLSKHFQAIINLHHSVNSNSKQEEIVRDLGNFNNIYFILYTNRKTDNNCKFLERHSDANLSFLNTKIKSEVHRFNFTKVKQPVSKIVSSSNLFLLSNQVNIEQSDKAIEAEIGKVRDTLKLSNLNIQHVAKGFSIHIRDWARGSLGGHYYFTKENVVYKLTELFLNQYTVNLIEKPLINYNNDKIEMWNRVIANQDIIVVDYSESALNFLIEVASSAVQKYFEDPLHNWAEKLSEKQQCIFYNTNCHLMEHIRKNVGNQGNIAPLDVYKSLWKINELPLLLQISDALRYKDIISILKLSEYSYQVIILCQNCNQDTNLPFSDKEDKKRFETLADLNEKEQNKILAQKVKLQGRPGAVLKDLINENLYQYIKCADILNILWDNFNIGENLHSLPDYFVDRIIIKTAIKPEVLKNHEEEIFLIEGTFEMLPESVCKYKVSKIEDIRFDNPSSIPGIINIQDFNLNQLQQLKSKNQPIHILSVYDGNHLQLKWSSEFTQTIERYKTKVTYVLQKEKINLFLQNTAIIYAVPGMGKTILMDYVANHAPIDKWVLRIDLSKHQPYFRKGKSTAKVQEHLKYFCDTIYKFNNNSASQLSQHVFQNFLTSKNVIALLDGYDEVAVSYKNEVANIAKALRQEGYTVCITMRPLMKEQLEKVFKTTSDTLQSFTRENQEDFLRKYFNAACKDLTAPEKLSTINTFVNKLLQAARINLNDRDAEFTGIPLQTRLLAEVFEDECGKCISNNDVNNFNPIFDLPFLYGKFVDIYLEKHGEFAYNVYEDIKIDQSLFALQLIFPQKFFTESVIMNNFNDAYKNSEKKKQQLEQVGIISLDEILNISCIHRTVAEYLSADWLIENCTDTNRERKKLACSLIQTRFSRKYEFLFHIFDKMVTKDCPLHWALLNGEYKAGIEILKEHPEEAYKIDEVGRSAVHVVTLNKLHKTCNPQNLSRIIDDRKLYYEIITKQILKHTTTVYTQIDAIGYNALDYAVATAFLIDILGFLQLDTVCLETANQIQEKLQTSVINSYIAISASSECLIHCYLHFPKLFHLFLPYFISRQLILKIVQNSSTIQDYLKSNTICFDQSLIDKYQSMTTLQILQSQLGHSYSGYVLYSNPPYYTDLRYAIIFGSENNVEKLLDEDSQINKSDLDDNIPLHYAVLHGKQKIAQLLLKKTSNINKQNKQGDTPLHLALRNGYNTISKLIITKGGEVNARNNNGDTPLYSARDENVAELIISKGGEVNTRNMFGDTPLHSVRDKNIAKLIISKGGDVNARNNKGDTPLHSVYAENARNANGNTALHRKNIAELIISKGGEVNARNNKGDTPLHYVCDENASKKHGNTSLYRKNMAELIISKGGDVNARNDNGDTPLHSTRDGNVVELLIAKGGEVNVRNMFGDTPLHSVRDKNIAELIIFKGGEVNARNNKGDTPLHSTCDANARNTNGNTSLHRKNIAELIISKGGEVNARNNKGDTPLHFLCDENVAELIIDKGGELNARNNDGDTPLHIASKSFFRINFVKLIIAKGAKLNIVNNDCKIPRAIALASGNDHIAQLL